MENFDVISICNALVDILVEVEDTDLKELSIEKGIMHLVDEDKQTQLLQHFKSKHLNVELGGSAMNATRSLASMGAKTAFVGMVGSDDFGSKIRTRMDELGIASRLGETSEPTGTSAILITPDGERTMNTCLGASSLYTEANVPHDDIKSAKIIHFAGYQWSTDHQKKAIKAAIETAKSNGTLVSFDVADPFVCNLFKDEFLQVIEQDADIVFANRDEAHSLYGLAPEEAAKKIAASGAIAVVKKGGEGAVVCKDGTLTEIAPIATKVVDTTAAGDMFAGGFLYGLVNGKPLEVCGKMAATLASDVISRLGAVVSDDALYSAKNLA